MIRTEAPRLARPTPPPPEMLIAGRWAPSDDGAIFYSADPATGEAVGAAPNGGATEAVRAVDAAHRAFADWSSRPAADRSHVLRAVGALLRERRDEIAALVTTEEGKPLREARGEVAFAADLLDWYAEEGRRAYGQWIPDPRQDRRLLTVRRPIGVAAAITPWNVPASMIARKAAPALAAGCTLVVKPAEQTPLTGLAIARAFHDAGVPGGVFNMVTGEPRPIGEAWLRDPRVRKLSFTGSTEVGRALMRGSADTVKRVSLELGGNAPFIVFDDADLDAVMAGLAAAKFRNCGQTCVSVNRIYVHEDLADAVAERLTSLASGLTVGNGLDDATTMGPLVDDQGLDKVVTTVTAAAEAGARVLTGGHRLTTGPHRHGFFYAPTVLTGVRDDMRIVREETFGPVAPIIPFTDEHQVVAAANATPYGLAAYVYTRDLSRALRVAERLEAGMVGINEQSVSAVEAPFGGVKLSGIGREGGQEGLAEFLETKLIALGSA